MPDFRVLTDDICDWSKRYKGDPFHAVLCDPPYNYQFMGKDWDDAVAMHPETWSVIAEHLLPGGFLMAFGGARTYHRLACAIEDAGLVIHPAMGWLNGQGFPKATRIDTQIDEQVFKDWLAENPDAQQTLDHYAQLVKDAKGTDGADAAKTQYDEFLSGYRKAAGAEREVVATVRRWGNAAGKGRGGQYANEYEPTVIGAEKFDDVTAPATPLAAQWEGHRYGLQAIKPALEFIALAQKPYEGKPVESIVETGAGALWIDGGRVGPADDTLGRSNKLGDNGWKNSSGGKNSQQLRKDEGLPAQGRWPANFALVHSPGCRRVGTRKVKGTGVTVKRNKDETAMERGAVYGQYKQLPGPDQSYADADGLEEVADWECEENCAIRRLGEQSGESKSPATVTSGGKTFHGGVYDERARNKPCHNDKGTAARFFHNADWEAEKKEPRLDPHHQSYSNDERSCIPPAASVDNDYTTEVAEQLYAADASWSYEVAEQIAAADAVRYQAKAGRKERDAGLDCEPKRFSLMDNRNRGGDSENYHFKTGSGKDRQVTYRNSHPTVKPIALTQWLATLLLPPDAYAPRRILVPFAGSGSEAIGAMLAGWDEITGIEINDHYAAIARARLDWWLNASRQTMFNNVKEILRLEA